MAEPWDLDPVAADQPVAPDPWETDPVATEQAPLDNAVRMNLQRQGQIDQEQQAIQLETEGRLASEFDDLVADPQYQAMRARERPMLRGNAANELQSDFVSQNLRDGANMLGAAAAYLPNPVERLAQPFVNVARREMGMQNPNVPLTQAYANLAAEGVTGLMQSGGDIASVAARPFSSEYADEINRGGQVLDSSAGEYNAQAGLPQLAGSTVRGVSRSLPTSAAGGAAFGPAGAIAMASGIRGNQALTEAKDAGLNEGQAKAYAMRAAAIEGGVTSIMQKMGLGGAEQLLFGKAVRRGILQGLKQTGAELFEENTTEILDNVNQALSGVEPDALTFDNVLDTAIATTAQTMLTMGVGHVQNIRPGQTKSQQAVEEAIGKAVEERQKTEETNAAKPNAELAPEAATADLTSPSDFLKSVAASAVEANPEAVAAIVAKGTLSRSDAERLGVSQRMNVEQREQLLQELKTATGLEVEAPKDFIKDRFEQGDPTIKDSLTVAAKAANNALVSQPLATTVVVDQEAPDVRRERGEQARKDRIAYIKKEAGKRLQDYLDSPDAVMTGGEIRSNINSYLEKNADEIGDVDAHGIMQSGKSFEQLDSILSKGIDKGRPFHTINLKSRGKAQIADRVGDPASFVLLAAPGKTLKEDGVAKVIVNGDYTHAIDDLSKTYPGVEFVDAGGAKQAKPITQYDDYEPTEDRAMAIPKDDKSYASWVKDRRENDTKKLTPDRREVGEYMTRTQRDFTGASRENVLPEILKDYRQRGTKGTFASVDLQGGSDVNKRLSIQDANAVLTDSMRAITETARELAPSAKFDVVRRGWTYFVVSNSPKLSKEAMEGPINAALQGVAKKHGIGDIFGKANVYSEDLYANKVAKHLNRSATQAIPEVPKADEIARKVEAGEYLSQAEQEYKDIATRKGWSDKKIQENAHEFAPFASSVATPGWLSAQMRDKGVARAAEHIKKTDGYGAYMDVDLANLGGLVNHEKAKLAKERGVELDSGQNGKAKDHATDIELRTDAERVADKHYTAIANIGRKVFSKLNGPGKVVEFYRYGGDELAINAVGISDEELSDAAKEFSAEVQKYISTATTSDGKPLADLVHRKAKDGAKPGVGIYYGIAPHTGSTDVISIAEKAVNSVKEARKDGEDLNDEYRGSSFTGGVAASSERPARAASETGRIGRSDSRSTDADREESREPVVRRKSMGLKERAPEEAGDGAAQADVDSKRVVYTDAKTPEARAKVLKQIINASNAAVVSIPELRELLPAWSKADLDAALTTVGKDLAFHGKDDAFVTPADERAKLLKVGNKEMVGIAPETDPDDSKSTFEIVKKLHDLTGSTDAATINGVLTTRTRASIQDALNEITGDTRAYQGHVGTEMQKDAVAGTESVSVDTYRKTLEHMFDIQTRRGRMPPKFRKADGVFQRFRRLIRLSKNPATSVLDGLTHEIAHVIDEDYKIVTGGKEITPEMRAELGELDYDAPKLTRDFEGFSEYMRHWIAGSERQRAEIEAKTPKFTAWWKDYLKRTPELGSKFARARDMGDRMHKIGSVGRLGAAIQDYGTTQKPELETSEQFRDTAEQIFDEFQHEWVNDLHYIEKFDKLAEKNDPNVFKTEASASENMQAFKRSGHAMAHRAIREGVYAVGENDFMTKLGPALDEVFGRKGLIKNDELHNWTTWIVARHGLEMIEKGINPGFSNADAQEVYESFKGNDRWERAAKKFTDYNNAHLDMAERVGLLTAEEVEAMKKKWETYIPSLRIQEGPLAFLGIGSSQAKFVDKGKLVKGRKGSTQAWVDPVQATIARSIQFYTRASQQIALNKLVETSRTVPALGKLVTDVTPKMKAVKVNDEAVRQAYKKFGILVDDSAATGDVEALNIWQPDYSSDPKEHIVRIIEDGKPKLIQLDAKLYSTLMGMDEQAIPTFLKFLPGMTTLFKAGATTYNTAFAAANALRDALTYAAYTKGGGKSGGLPYAMGEYVAGQIRELSGGSHSKMVKLFQAMGGEISHSLSLEGPSIKNEIKNIQGKVSLNPLNLITALTKFSEMAPRVAEFRASLARQGFDEAHVEAGKPIPRSALVRAKNDSADVTLNFNRAGAYGKKVNQIVPYFNPSIQGTDKMFRQLKQNPKRLLSVASGLAALTLAYWLNRKDEDWYKELPDWQKYGFWIFRKSDIIPWSTDNSPWLYIPRPEGLLRTFCTVTEAGADSIYRKDKAAFNDGLKEAGKKYVPNWQPAGWGTFEAMTNYDYFKMAPIVDPWKSKLLPRDQTNKKDLETSKIIGELFGVSPARAEHMINQTTGGLYRSWIGGGERLVLGKEWNGKDLPFVGAVLSRQEYHKSPNDFYDKVGKLEAEYESAKLRGQDTPKQKSDLDRMHFYGKLLKGVREEKAGATGARELELSRIESVIARRALERDELKDWSKLNIPGDIKADALEKILRAEATLKPDSVTRLEAEKGLTLKQKQANWSAAKRRSMGLRAELGVTDSEKRKAFNAMADEENWSEETKAKKWKQVR